MEGSLVIPVHVVVETTVRTTGQRVREMDEWYLVEFAPNEYRLDGRCHSEDGVILTWTRYTQTSPIKRREGRTLITESGSRYTLLEPHARQNPNGYLMFDE